MDPPPRSSSSSNIYPIGSGGTSISNDDALPTYESTIRNSSPDTGRNSKVRRKKSGSRQQRPKITIVSCTPMSRHPAFADGRKGGFIPGDAPPTYDEAMKNASNTAAEYSNNAEADVDDNDVEDLSYLEIEIYPEEPITTPQQQPDKLRDSSSYGESSSNNHNNNTPVDETSPKEIVSKQGPQQPIRPPPPVPPVRKPRRKTSTETTEDQGHTNPAFEFAARPSSRPTSPKDMKTPTANKPTPPVRKLPPPPRPSTRPKAEEPSSFVDSLVIDDHSGYATVGGASNKSADDQPSVTADLSCETVQFTVASAATTTECESSSEQPSTSDTSSASGSNSGDKTDLGSLHASEAHHEESSSTSVQDNSEQTSDQPSSSNTPDPVYALVQKPCAKPRTKSLSQSSTTSESKVNELPAVQEQQSSSNVANDEEDETPPPLPSTRPPDDDDDEIVVSKDEAKEIEEASPDAAKSAESETQITEDITSVGENSLKEEVSSKTSDPSTLHGTSDAVAAAITADVKHEKSQEKQDSATAATTSHTPKRTISKPSRPAPAKPPILAPKPKPALVPKPSTTTIPKPSLPLQPPPPPKPAPRVKKQLKVASSSPVQSQPSTPTTPVAKPSSSSSTFYLNKNEDENDVKPAAPELELSNSGSLNSVASSDQSSDPSSKSPVMRRSKGNKTSKSVAMMRRKSMKLKNSALSFLSPTPKTPEQPSRVIKSSPSPAIVDQSPPQVESRRQSTTPRSAPPPRPAAPPSRPALPAHLRRGSGGGSSPNPGSSPNLGLTNPAFSPNTSLPTTATDEVVVMSKLSLNDDDCHSKTSDDSSPSAVGTPSSTTEKYSTISSSSTTPKTRPSRPAKRPTRPAPPVSTAAKEKAASLKVKKEKVVDVKIRKLISEEEFCVAVEDYQPRDFSGISVKKGEKVFVLMNSQGGNVFARNEEGEEGFLPSSCLQPEEEGNSNNNNHANQSPAVTPINSNQRPEAEENAVNSNNLNQSAAAPCVECALKQSVAITDFSSQVAGDIQFKTGDMVEILDQVDSEWFRGRRGQQVGIFPRSFVSTPTYPTYPALYAFQGRHDDELNFEAGDDVTLIGRIDTNWLQGVCNGRAGKFPAAFISETSL